MHDLNEETVLEQLQPIFQEALNSPTLVVTRSSSATNTANWDSLAHIELIEMVEYHFKVKFALGELHQLREVGDLVDMILKKKAPRN